VAQRGIDVDPLIGQQPVHLLDRMLGHPTAGQGEPQSDRVDRQRRGLDDAERGVGQGQHALGVQVAIEQAGHEAVYFSEAEGLGRSHHGASPIVSSAPRLAVRSANRKRPSPPADCETKQTAAHESFHKAQMPRMILLLPDAGTEEMRGLVRHTAPTSGA
jgi:hypothetical protein